MEQLGFTLQGAVVHPGAADGVTDCVDQDSVTRSWSTWFVQTYLFRYLEFMLFLFDVWLFGQKRKNSLRIHTAWSKSFMSDIIYQVGVLFRWQILKSCKDMRIYFCATVLFSCSIALALDSASIVGRGDVLKYFLPFILLLILAFYFGNYSKLEKGN